jgi:hypothetical protein
MKTKEIPSNASRKLLLKPKESMILLFWAKAGQKKPY